MPGAKESIILLRDHMSPHKVLTHCPLKERIPRHTHTWMLRPELCTQVLRSGKSDCTEQAPWLYCTDEMPEALQGYAMWWHEDQEPFAKPHVSTTPPNGHNCPRPSFSTHLPVILTLELVGARYTLLIPDRPTLTDEPTPPM